MKNLGITMDLFNNQQARDAAIKAMHEYHLAYKAGQSIDTTEVKQSLKKLSQSDRTFMFIIGNTSNPLVAIPSINYDIKKNTLNKLIMAYFYFKKETENKMDSQILVVQADNFYKSVALNK